LLLNFSAVAAGALNLFFVVLADCHCEGETLATLFAMIFVKRHKNPPQGVSLASQPNHYSAAMIVFNLQA
jgi:hypothetical protein